MIELLDVSYAYLDDSVYDVKQVDLTIGTGEFVVLTGKSGCGKTTITRIINGLAAKFYEGRLTGRVLVDSEDLNNSPLWKIGREIGSIFQDPRSQFFASLTEDELAFGCENYGIDRLLIEERIKNAVREINGENLIGREIYPMSSGEKQKIAIASIYAVNPGIYVFDEPSANLDMASVIKLRDLMGVLKKSGATIVVAEHRLYYLTGLADRFIFMEDGHLIKEFSPKQIEEMKIEEKERMGLRTGNLQVCTGQLPYILTHDKPSVQIDSLTFSYGKNEIFSGLSLKAYPGDVIALIGPNGVGKSTLGQILCGLLKEISGSVSFNRNKVTSKKRRKKAYYVMQNTDCQLFGESVREELALNQTSQNEQEIEEVLRRYGLWEYRERHPASLSGGQKQRLTLAVADIIDTDILILDEPTSGLDGENMRIISEHLKQLSRKGKTLFVVTHDYEFAVATCNRALQLLKGCCHMDFNINKNEKLLLSCMQEREK